MGMGPPSQTDCHRLIVSLRTDDVGDAGSFRDYDEVKLAMWQPAAFDSLANSRKEAELCSRGIYLHRVSDFVDFRDGRNTARAFSGSPWPAAAGVGNYSDF